MAVPKRSETLAVRFRPHEATAVRVGAEAEGMRLSEFIRRACLREVSTVLGPRGPREVQRSEVVV